jgi:hypothetical protein
MIMRSGKPAMLDAVETAELPSDPEEQMLVSEIAERYRKQCVAVGSSTPARAVLKARLIDCGGQGT